MDNKIILKSEDFEEQINKIRNLYFSNTNQKLLLERLKKVFFMLAITNNYLLKQKFELIIYNLYYDLCEEYILNFESVLEMDAFLQVIGLKTRDEYFKKIIDIKKLEIDKVALEKKLQIEYSNRKNKKSDI